jgi:hypothetical protein
MILSRFRFIRSALLAIAPRIDATMQLEVDVTGAARIAVESSVRTVADQPPRDHK